MMRFSKRVASRVTVIMILVAAICRSSTASAANPANPAALDPTRDFITTCTYGALAGGLVGAATLAFSSDPGDKISNVARGASLGLYAGIALGLYMLNASAGGSEDDAAAAAAAGITQNEPTQDSLPNSSDEAKARAARLAAIRSAKSVRQANSFGIALIPLVSEHGIEGASAQVRLGTF